MVYCDTNANASSVWYDHGVSPCFMDTISSCFFLLYMLPYGIWKVFMYKRHATLVDQTLKPHSRLYTTQILLHYVRIFSPISLLLLQYWSQKAPFYGHLLLKNVSEMIVWSLSLILIKFKRNYDLSHSSNGHGLAMIILWSVEFFVENVSFVTLLVSGNSSWWKVYNQEDQITLGIYCERYFCILAIFVIGLKAPGLPITNQTGTTDEATLKTAESESANRKTSYRKTWKDFITLLPHLWPKNSIKIQICVVFCVVTFIADRVSNLYLPICNKWIVDSLSSQDEESKKLAYRWDFILLYVSLEFGQTCVHYINHELVWNRVDQHMTSAIQVYLYKHLHELSLRWHLSRKTGEVLKVMDRGANSINRIITPKYQPWSSLFCDVITDIAPAVIDLTVAIVFFSSYFNIWLGLTVAITLVVYTVTTYYASTMRKKYYKEVKKTDNEFESKAVDALLNFETVKYYNAEEYEINRYRDSLLKSQIAQRTLSTNISAINVLEQFITKSGQFAGCMLCAWFIVHNWQGFTVGTYVLFGSYIGRLYRPIYWLAQCYKSIQRAFIDIESMFEILNQDKEIKDEPDALDLEVKSGRIEFRNVYFSYTPEKPTLKNVSFVVEPGKTLAIVGPSGSGKSTVIRLIFRFYDVNSGTILIDDQDISKTRQKSLRQNIGVVPQDTVLFNDSIKYNIKYGRNTATDDELFASAQAAEIHDKILSFPEGYDAMVGERGLKLSGGEKQRVAIARTILKAPKFVLLDEATSALDTQTERLIQASLDEICVGRTTIVVAHRLSTIVDADEILVLKDGEVVERGTQEELMNKNGLYASMWRQQLEKPISKSSSTNSLKALKQEAGKHTLSPLINKDYLL